MKTNVLYNKTNEELQQQLKELKSELFYLRFKHAPPHSSIFTMLRRREPGSEASLRPTSTIRCRRSPASCGPMPNG